LAAKTSQTASPVPLVIGICQMPLPAGNPAEVTVVVALTGVNPPAPSTVDSDDTNCAAVPVSGFAVEVNALLTVETKMLTPFGTLLKTARRRVPKSARPHDGEMFVL